MAGVEVVPRLGCGEPAKLACDCCTVATSTDCGALKISSAFSRRRFIGPLAAVMLLVVLKYWAFINNYVQLSNTLQSVQRSNLPPNTNMLF